MSSWSAYLCDTMTGRINAPIDLPSFSWNISISDSSLATTRDKGVGQHETSGLTLPWEAIPGSTYEQKRRNIAPMRRSLAVFRTSNDPAQRSSLGTPIIFGAIGVRKDTVNDTSFSLMSPMSILASRYAVREGQYGTGPNHTSPNSIRFDNLSYRAIASEVGYLCTDLKPGGTLPIDWQYRGEKGTRSREYDAWDIQNNSAADILTKIANVLNGPDMQFRPYLTADGRYVRWRFVAGDDETVYLGLDRMHELSYHPYGATIENITVDHLGPVQRVYTSGAGTDKAQITHLSQDLGLSQSSDPYPLTEMTYADSDTDNPDVLISHADATLAANKYPLMQISGDVHANDTDQTGTPLLPLGSYWPGEPFQIVMQGHRALPDGIYRTRLMQMSGDETDKVSMIFDVMCDPDM